MSLLDAFRGHTEISSVVNREDLLSRYKQTRRVCTNLNNKLVQRLSRDVLYEGGQRIGVLKSGQSRCDLVGTGTCCESISAETGIRGN